MSNSASSNTKDQSSLLKTKSEEVEEAELQQSTESDLDEPTKENQAEEKGSSDLSGESSADQPPSSEENAEKEIDADAVAEETKESASDQATAKRKTKSSNKENTEDPSSSKKPARTKKPKTKSKTSKKTDKSPSNKSGSLLGKISDVTSSAFKFARKTTDTSYKVGKAIIQSQDQLKLMVAAGQSLKDLREVAGLTISELNDSLQLKDKTLLEAVEGGTATLSFELILRLSALLARNDPIPFILKYSRTYSPETWKLLNDWGAGRLPIQYQREREFINIFRSKDEARQLSDEGYNKVLEFTREAFNMSLHFVSEQEASVKELKETLKAQAEAELKSDSSKEKPTEE